jgi:cytidylate kinase
MKQILISVDRQFGSGGKDIAHLIGDHYNIPVYHHSLLKRIGIHESYDLDQVRQDYDEAPRIKGMTRTVRGMTNSNTENITQKEFELLKKLAREGKSYVVIGHCGETILKEFGCISIFVSADQTFRTQRTMDTFGESEEQAFKHIHKMDKKRKSYHNHYCDNHRWSDARDYDITIKSSVLGIEESAKVLIDYIDKILKEDETEAA